MSKDQQPVPEGEGPTCPECGVDARRPKCLHDLPPNECPRHEALRNWRQSTPQETPMTLDRLLRDDVLALFGDEDRSAFIRIVKFAAGATPQETVAPPEIERLEEVYKNSQLRAWTDIDGAKEECRAAENFIAALRSELQQKNRDIEQLSDHCDANHEAWVDSEKAHDATKAALAQSEEARRRAEARLKLAKSLERQRPLCPDHRDKAAGECLLCRLEQAEAQVSAARSALEPFAKQCEAILSVHEGPDYSVIAPKVTVWQGKDAIETLEKLRGTDESL